MNRLLPEQIDNHYRGRVLAIWLFGPLALAKLLQGANIAGLLGTGRSRQILESADRVPVSEFPPEAASHLVFLFAAWGLGVFLLGLLGMIVLIRYRGMIPLLFLILLVEQVGRKSLSSVHLGHAFWSVSASAANLINWAFLLAAGVGLALSLARRKQPTAPA